jgi:hypothetical protein
LLSPQACPCFSLPQNNLDKRQASAQKSRASEFHRDQHQPLIREDENNSGAQTGAS